MCTAYAPKGRISRPPPWIGLAECDHGSRRCPARVPLTLSSPPLCRSTHYHNSVNAIRHASNSRSSTSQSNLRSAITAYRHASNSLPPSSVLRGQHDKSGHAALLLACCSQYPAASQQTLFVTATPRLNENCLASVNQLIFVPKSATRGGGDRPLSGPLIRATHRGRCTESPCLACRDSCSSSSVST
jgi:hypothetical protein